MYVIASFEQSIFLELAISALEQKGIQKHQVLAVPLDKRTEERRLFDTIHKADGYSLFDVGAVLGTCGMLLGVIYGMVLQWGPILWGLIGLTAGLTVGILFKLVITKRQNRQATQKSITTEVFLLIHCDAAERTMIENILWDNLAIGLAKLEDADV